MDIAKTDSTLQTTKYVISLDAIDLSMIPATFNRYSSPGVTPLWTKANLDLRENEYFEFEIKHDQSSNDGAKSKLENVFCYTCNCEIPKPYLKAHFNSQKHETYREIINVSLERMKNVINQIDVFEDLHSTDSEYFCPSCVSVIDVEDRVLHEKTIMHKNSLIIDKILNDFLDIYNSGDKTSEDKSYTESKTENITNTSQQDSIDDNILYRNTKQDSLSPCEGIDEKNQVQGPELEITANTSPGVGNMQHTLQNYIEFLNLTYKYNNIKFLNDSNVVIDIISGTRFKIFETNFYGMTKASAHIYKCLLCSKHITKKDKWSHLYDKEHLERVAVPYTNENCIRRIDEVSSHCVLCNMSLQSETEHISRNNHKQNLIRMTLVNPNNNYSSIVEDFEDTSKNSQIENENTEVQNSNKTMVLNRLTEVLTEFLSKFSKVNITDTYQDHGHTFEHDTNDNVNADIHYLMKTDSNNCLLCRICNENVQTSEVDVNAHLKKISHKVNYNKLLNTNTIRKVEKFSFHCRICGDNFVKTEELTHIESKKHRDKENTKDKLVFFKKDSIDIDDQSFRCTVCEMNIPKHNYNIYTHLMSKAHKNKVLCLDTSEITCVHYHIDLIDLSVINCMVCHKLLECREKAILDHMDGNHHRENYKRLLNNNQLIEKNNNLSCNVCLIDIPHLEEILHCLTKKHIENLNGINVNIPSANKANVTTLHSENTNDMNIKLYLLKDFGNTKDLYCVACDVRVSIGNCTTIINRNTKQHLNGQPHKINYERILKDNYVVTLCDDFMCTLCNVVCVTGKEFDHIATMKHQDNLINLSKHYCLVCNVKLTKNEENISHHNNGLKHKQMINLASENNIQVDQNYFCETCQKNIIDESVLEHIKRSEHLHNEFVNGK